MKTVDIRDATAIFHLGEWRQVLAVGEFKKGVISITLGEVAEPPPGEIVRDGFRPPVVDTVLPDGSRVSHPLAMGYELDELRAEVARLDGRVEDLESATAAASDDTVTLRNEPGQAPPDRDSAVLETRCLPDREAE